LVYFREKVYRNSNVNLKAGKGKVKDLPGRRKWMLRRGTLLGIEIC